ncbi:hypothetical protein CCYA_CCYA11G3024 [Cyanidiococcus yangmingshanensis]|nr:hypothetical protein CCYA_CCYA11G3024 [Cyanidiococcus yangmingshanensis]
MSSGQAVPTLTGEIVQVLYKLQSPDTVVIREAESRFDELVTSEPVATYDVLTHVSTAPASALGLADAASAVALRSSAAVLLRQRIVALESAALTAGSLDVIATARQRLLLALQSDSSAEYTTSELRKICSAVATLGGVAIAASDGTDDGESGKRVAPWPELFNVVYALAASPMTRQRAVGLNLLAGLIDYLDDDTLRPHMQHLHEILRVALADADAEVREHATGTLRAILETADSKHCLLFTDLVPLLFSSIETSLSADNEEDARKSIEEVIEMLQSEPRLFRDHFGTMASAMLALVGNAALEDETRQIALEFLTVCAEHLRSSTRRNPQFVEQLVPACMQMMTELEDDKEWYEKDSITGPENEDGDGDAEYTNVDAAQGSLDRIAIALGGKTVLPVASRWIQEFLQRGDDWRFRHAAIMTINQIGEGCEKQMERQLGDVIELVVNATTDAHPRVRWAAINCIGQMSTDFGGVLQRKYHARVLPTLIHSMDDGCNRVRSHAAAALINFCDEASSSALTPYLDAVVSKLIALLNSNSRLALEQAMTAVAAVAGCVGTAFSKYYDDFMPPLKNLLRQTSAGDKRNRLLRSKTMECMTLIGVAVGADRFRADADEIMQILVSNQMSMQFDADDPQIGYMMQAYARICQSLGELFVPYLPYVLPALCEMARMKPDIQLFPGKDEDTSEDFSGLQEAAGVASEAEASRTPDGYATVDFGNKKLGIRTSSLDDRATAVSILASFASELKGALFPYLMDITQIMVENLGFWYHDECRQFAADAIPDLVSCASEHFAAQGDVERTRGAVQEIVNFFLPKLCDAARNEPEVEVQSSMVEALCSMIERAGSGVLDAQQCIQVARFVIDILLERQDRVRERLLSQAEDYELDDEELRNLQEEDQWDDDVLVGCGDTVRAALEHDGSNGFITAFETLLEPTAQSSDDDDDEHATPATGPTEPRVNPASASTTPPQTYSLASLFASMLSQERSATERSVALSTWAAWLRYGGPRGLAYLPQVFPAFAAYLKDTEPQVQEAAAYGIRICAECTDPQLFTNLDRTYHIVQALEQIVRDRNARDDEDTEKAADNAASALLRIAMHQPHCLSSAAPLKSVLQYLPVQVDVQEADSVINALIHLLQHPGILGKHAPMDTITFLIARQVAVAEDALEEPTLGLARQVFVRMPPAVLKQLLQHLASTNAEEYETFRRLIPIDANQLQ